MIWVSGELGCAKLTPRLDNLKDLFQSKQLYNSMNQCSLNIDSYLLMSLSHSL